MIINLDFDNSEEKFRFIGFWQTCLTNEEFVKEYERLNDTKMFRHMNRSPIEIAVDQATGYEDQLIKEEAEQQEEFMRFTYDLWQRFKYQNQEFLA